ncbi:MAG TPA: energy transducer TonB [Nitrospirota bacterium]|nr:energy transducer TonB [Nitrospirota bacterium]
MTFQRSLYISLFSHIVFFGSILAFAQFTRGALWGNWDVTVVSLVSSEAGGQGRGLQNRVHREALSVHKPEVTQETASPAERPETPSLGESIQEDVHEDATLSGGSEDNNVGTGDAGNDGSPHGQPGGGSSGSGSDEQLGLASAEQWAVIVSSIERVKSYPRIARERGIEGVVHLRFRVRPGGEVDRVEVVKSSGYEILDTASVRTVYRAAPMPYVRGWIEVPIAYVLK